MNSFLYFHKWNLEIEGFFYDSVECLFWNIFTKEEPRGGFSYFSQFQSPYFVEERAGKLFNFFGHVEPSVRCEPSNNCFLQGSGRDFLICAVVVHLVTISKFQISDSRFLI